MFGCEIPFKEFSFNKLIEWFIKGDRHVALDKIGKITISTILIDKDHRFKHKGKYFLYETKIYESESFEPDYRCNIQRYHDYHEAKHGHKEWIKKVIRDGLVGEIIHNLKDLKEY